MTAATTRRRLPRFESVMRHPLTQVAFGYLALCFLYYNWLLFWAASALEWNDFGKFFYGTQAWRQGGLMYAPNEATWMRVGSTWMNFLDLNPPHFHLLVIPLVSSPAKAAAIVWAFANIACAGAAVGLAWLEVRPTIHPSRLLPLACLALLTAATGANVVTVQCTGFLMLPMTLAWRAARRDHWESAGAWLGALISVKPFLGLFLPMLLLRRRFTAVGVACATGVACTLLGVGVFGWSAYVEWFRALSHVTWAWAGMNASTQGLLSRAFEMSPTFTPVLSAPAIVTPLWIIGSLVVLAASTRAMQGSADRAFAVVTLASLLISPLGWVYYLWLAFPGCLALWRGGAPVPLWLAVALTCNPLFALTVGQPSGVWTVAFGSAYFWGLLTIWGLSIRTGGEPAA